MSVALLTETEVAQRLKVSLACLRRWRLKNRGPSFLKVGSLVRYPVDEFDSRLRSLPRKGPGGSNSPPSAIARSA